MSKACLRSQTTWPQAVSARATAGRAAVISRLASRTVRRMGRTLRHAETDRRPAFPQVRPNHSVLEGMTRAVALLGCSLALLLALVLPAGASADSSGPVMVG